VPLDGTETEHGCIEVVLLSVQIQQAGDREGTSTMQNYFMVKSPQICVLMLGTVPPAWPQNPTVTGMQRHVRTITSFDLLNPTETEVRLACSGVHAASQNVAARRGVYKRPGWGCGCAA
jgi:hypothetical protein